MLLKIVILVASPFNLQSKQMKNIEKKVNFGGISFIINLFNIL